MHKVNENSIQKVHKENINTIFHYIKSKKKKNLKSIMPLRFFYFGLYLAYNCISKPTNN